MGRRPRRTRFGAARASGPESAGGGTGRTLAEWGAFKGRQKEVELKYFGQEIFQQAEAKAPLSDPRYLKALRRCRLLSRAEGVDLVMRKHRLDALIAPTGGPPSLIDLVNGDPSGGRSFSTPAAVSGYPHITVPAGYVLGLPVGLSFMGQPWTEGKLIKYAYAFEQATKARKAPRFLPTAPVELATR